MWHFCFTFNGKTHCIRIPLLVDSFWRLLKPRPDPWLVLDERPFEHALDLQVLATIADLSRDLSPELGRTVNAGIEEAFSRVKRQLPEGAELHFHARRAIAE
jgi:hypothetical protein